MSPTKETAQDSMSVRQAHSLPENRQPVRPAQATEAQTAGKGRFLAKKTVDDRKRGGPDSTSPVTGPRPPDKPLISGEEESWEKDDTASEAISAEAGSPPNARKARKKGAGGLGRILRFGRLPMLPTLVAGAFFAALVAFPVYHQGVKSGLKQAQADSASLDMPPDVTAEVDGALIELRNGDARKALATLKNIHEKQPRYPTVSYLVALAATQVGDVDLAEKCLAETMANRERVSDAMALRAVLESMKPPGQTMGDPKVKAENHLRQAILADPANAAPRFELATLLRYSNRRDEARKEIRAAQARLNPVDAHTVMDVTLALMDLEDKSDEALPATPTSARNLSEAFGGALIALRKGDFAQASQFLDTAKAMTSYDIFFYLVNDPVLRRYRDQPEVAKFWP